MARRLGGRLKLVSRFPERFNSRRLTRPFGSVRFVSAQVLINTRLRLVNASGKEQFLNALNWKVRSTVVSFVSVDGMDTFSRKLDWRSSETRLRAASRPSRLKILRWLAFKLVRVRRSCWVRGPVGLCKASRIAESNPGSGMTTPCATIETGKQAKRVVAKIEKTVCLFIVFV
jgi:hypothetical protein